MAHILIISGDSISNNMDRRPGLTDAEISQTANVIPPECAQKFAVEHLGTEFNEFKIIHSDKGFLHHDTLIEVLDRWRAKCSSEEKDAKRQLCEILQTIQQTKGWFSLADISFLLNDDKMDISEEGECRYIL